MLLPSLAATAAANAPAADANLATEIRAAYLKSFADFVTWPPPAGGESGEIVFCVFGDDPIAPALERMLAGRIVAGRACRVRRLGASDTARACRVLYAGAGASREAAAALPGLRTAPVLTVGDFPGFVTVGGIIELRVEDRKLRFDINLKAAEKAGLKLSSKLLGMARIVP
jgi:hypothetical protein